MKNTSQPKLIKDIMTPHVQTVHPNETLREAAQKMRHWDIGSLPVVETGNVLGILTDRDITIYGTAEGRDPDTLIREVLTGRKLISCYEDQDISAAANVMEKNEVRRLPVFSRDRKLVGMLSLSDFANKTLNKNLSAEMLEAISEPALQTD